MTPAVYLVDTSALFRILDQPDIRKRWEEQLIAGIVAVCPIVELEFLFTARSLSDRLEKQRLLRATFGWVPMSELAFQGAAELQQRLTEHGQHRSAGPADLLIAVTAERERLTILSDDRDFETIARVTGQPVQRVTDTAEQTG